MFEYLGRLSEELGKRYKTLENNLKSSSNSFFDSYREIVQEFIKVVLAEGGTASKKIQISKELNGAELLGRLYAVGTEESAIEKIRNYVLKTNSHVHKTEKELTFGATVDYLSALYRFTYPFAIHEGLNPKEPTLDEIQHLYAEYEKSSDARRMFSESFEERFDRMEKDAEENRIERERARLERERTEEKERAHRENEEKARHKALIQTLYNESASNICYFGSNLAFKRFKYALLALFLCYFTIGSVPFFFINADLGMKIFTVLFLTIFRFLPILYLFLFVGILSLKTENHPFFDGKTMYSIPYFEPWKMEFKKRYTVGLVFTLLFDIGAAYGTVIEYLSPFMHWLIIIADIFGVAIYIIGRIFYRNFSISHIEGLDRAGIYRDMYVVSSFFITKDQYIGITESKNKSERQ